MMAHGKTPGMTSSRYSTLIASQMKTRRQRNLFPTFYQSLGEGQPKE
jgi:hypothetical protein